MVGCSIAIAAACGCPKVNLNRTVEQHHVCVNQCWKCTIPTKNVSGQTVDRFSYTMCMMLCTFLNTWCVNPAGWFVDNRPSQTETVCYQCYLNCEPISPTALFCTRLGWKWSDTDIPHSMMWDSMIWASVKRSDVGCWLGCLEID